MRTPCVSRLAAMLCLIASLSAGAVSTPPIAGTISGTEYCVQFLCDFAFFAGSFAGTVDNKRTRGTFWVQVTHEPLPNAAITGGSWVIRTKRGEFAGTVTGGQVTANGDDTFNVTALLQLTFGGSGSLTFNGLLDHNEFPPTIDGTVSQ